MAEASRESVQRLIDNSEKGLSQIEMSLPAIMEARMAVEETIKKQGDDSVALELLMVVLDCMLAEQEVIYDLSASLDALLKATDDYPKRYYMQSLNLCFWEACQLCVGVDEGDDNGLLTKMVALTKQLNHAGCQFLAQHIIDDIQEFRKVYVDRELRNITRHYDDPIKMYEAVHLLDNIDFFANGASQLMAIRMEVSVVSYYLLTLLTPKKDTVQSSALASKKGCDLKGMFNDAIFKALKEKDLKKEVERTLNRAQGALDESYRLYKGCGKAVEFLKEKGSEEPKDFKKLESLLKLRMETQFLRYDMACSVWGYLNATSDMERSQNLRLIHITKQAALTHIYGYNEKARERSLWAEIKRIEEATNRELNADNVEKSLRELTGNLDEAKINSQVFAHYRYKQDFYIPARIEAFDKMVHAKELMDVLKLLNVCKELEGYTMKLLLCMDGNMKQRRKKQLDEWMGMLSSIESRVGGDEKVTEALKPMREMIENMFGEK